MSFINNAWGVIYASLSSRLGFFLGLVLTFYAYVNTSSPHIQEVLHFTAWSEWVPWVLGLATAFGVPIGRGVKQDSVTKAANK